MRTGESGTRHLQGTLCLNKRARLTEMKKIHQSIHWEGTKSISKSIAYCTKEETRHSRQWSKGVDIAEELDLTAPYGWQLAVMNIIARPVCKRSIYWFWEPDGNVDKSELCSWLVAKHNALMLSGRPTDMYHMISKFLKKGKIMIIDLPRSARECVNYEAIEHIKNGLVFSCQVQFNRPHVIGFSNAKPFTHQMSTDRWYVIDIRELMKNPKSHDEIIQRSKLA